MSTWKCFSKGGPWPAVTETGTPGMGPPGLCFSKSWRWLLAQQVSPGCVLESGVPDEHSTCRDLGDPVTFILLAATALVLGSWITKGKSLEWLRSIALEGGREVSTLQVKNKSSLVCEKSWTCTTWAQELAYRESVRRPLCGVCGTTTQLSQKGSVYLEGSQLQQA